MDKHSNNCNLYWCAGFNTNEPCSYNANMTVGMPKPEYGASDTDIIQLRSSEEGEPDSPDDPGQDGQDIPELVTWECKKGHAWKTYGEVAFMTFIDPLSSEEISTGPICVKCYFKSLEDYFSATKKEDTHGYRP